LIDLIVNVYPVISTIFSPILEKAPEAANKLCLEDRMLRPDDPDISPKPSSARVAHSVNELASSTNGH
jgi:hypothetical protein